MTEASKLNWYVVYISVYLTYCSLYQSYIQCTDSRYAEDSQYILDSFDCIDLSTGLLIYFYFMYLHREMNGILHYAF